MGRARGRSTAARALFHGSVRTVMRTLAKRRPAGGRAVRPSRPKRTAARRRRVRRSEILWRPVHGMIGHRGSLPRRQWRWWQGSSRRLYRSHHGKNGPLRSSGWSIWQRRRDARVYFNWRNGSTRLPGALGTNHRAFFNRRAPRKASCFRRFLRGFTGNRTAGCFPSRRFTSSGGAARGLGSGRFRTAGGFHLLWLLSYC